MFKGGGSSVCVGGGGARGVCMRGGGSVCVCVYKEGVDCVRLNGGGCVGGGGYCVWV